MKKCNTCGKNKSLDKFYQYIKKKASGDEYIYYRPDCKSCTTEKARNWYKNHPEKFKESQRKYNSKPHRKEARKELNKRCLEDGTREKWIQSNKNRLKRYQHERYYNKNHSIKKEEWKSCKEYFNYECAYCGLSESEHRELYKQDLHKEHVIHNGSNDLSNCVPSCKSCNSRKHTYSLENWYTEDNDVYNISRIKAIKSWLEIDYLKYIK